MMLFDDEKTRIGAIVDPVERFLAYVEEREAIRLRRADGRRWPYSSDWIFQQYVFDNVHREDDRTTREIVALWRTPHSTDPDLWFAMTEAVWVNHPPTLHELGYPDQFDPNRFVKIIKDRQRRGERVESSAYRIQSDPRSPGRPKCDYIAFDILQPLWAACQRLRPRRGDRLEDFSGRLRQHKGFREGGFYAGQVVASIKYCEPLKNAEDWWTFALPGPGSEAGLNLVLGRSIDAKWSETEWRRELDALHRDIALDLKRIGIDRLHAQDLQNCLCEFRRYECIRLDLKSARRMQRKYRALGSPGSMRW
jgi:5-hmdU DNA kinase, helical domain